jgi:hypothetical protein
VRAHDTETLYPVYPIHFDGVRYCFKKDPNVTLLIERESNAASPLWVTLRV